MPGITAAAVKALRERTGLPMMDCKKALTECGGDEEKAVDWLRGQGLKTMEKRSGRETSFGRMGLYKGLDKDKGAMVELKCESAPVTQNEEFVQLADDLARQLAELQRALPRTRSENGSARGHALEAQPRHN